ncbi:MAG: hypothetical protein LQ337_001932 [Flavoplaca oasis]|nr:MAG: hypothetical protein LQ337_001932 [Flavoplaca oasis]
MGARCINVQKYFVISGSINTFTDFALLAMPIPILWRLRTGKPQKLLLTGIFTVGLIVCVVSIVRLVILANVDQSDITWNYVPAAIWSAAEPSVAVVSACLPSLRPLFVRVIWGGTHRPKPTTPPRQSVLSWRSKSVGGGGTQGSFNRLQEFSNDGTQSPWLQNSVAVMAVSAFCNDDFKKTFDDCVKSAKSVNQTAKVSVANMAKELESAQQNLADLPTQLRDKASRVAHLEAEASEHNEKVTGLEQTIGRLNAKVGSMQSNLESLTADRQAAFHAMMTLCIGHEISPEEITDDLTRKIVKGLSTPTVEIGAKLPSLTLAKPATSVLPAMRSWVSVLMGRENDVLKQAQVLFATAAQTAIPIGWLEVGTASLVERLEQWRNRVDLPTFVKLCLAAIQGMTVQRASANKVMKHDESGLFFLVSDGALSVFTLDDVDDVVWHVQKDG